MMMMTRVSVDRIAALFQPAWFNVVRYRPQATRVSAHHPSLAQELHWNTSFSAALARRCGDFDGVWPGFYVQYSKLGRLAVAYLVMLSANIKRHYLRFTFAHLCRRAVRQARNVRPILASVQPPSRAAQNSAMPKKKASLIRLRTITVGPGSLLR